MPVATRKLCCDRCDGPHATERCPHFKKAREDHEDAWKMFGKGFGSTNADACPVIVPSHSARVISQPGDGSCLFHSLTYGLSRFSLSHGSASSLRQEVCRFIREHPETRICDTTIKDWVKYDSSGSVQSYADKMSGSAWGGGIEMAVVTLMRRVNVHVYESSRAGYKRISTFDVGSDKTVSVLYQGRMHFDAIIIS
jgi:hypothetical protein